MPSLHQWVHLARLVIVVVYSYSLQQQVTAGLRLLMTSLLVAWVAPTSTMKTSQLKRKLPTQFQLNFSMSCDQSMCTFSSRILASSGGQPTTGPVTLFQCWESSPKMSCKLVRLFTTELHSWPFLFEMVLLCSLGRLWTQVSSCPSSPCAGITAPIQCFPFIYLVSVGRSRRSFPILRENKYLAVFSSGYLLFSFHI